MGAYLHFAITTAEIRTRAAIACVFKRPTSELAAKTKSLDGHAMVDVLYLSQGVVPFAHRQLSIKCEKKKILFNN